MFKAAEFHVLSFSSCLASLTVADVMDKKFLLAVLPHEEMPDRKAWFVSVFSIEKTFMRFESI